MCIRDSGHAGERADQVLRDLAVALGQGQHVLDVPVGVVVGEDRVTEALGTAGGLEVAGGGTERLRDAIFAYNHANWYVEDVLALTEGYSQIPEHLISSLSGMTEGAHFPVCLLYTSPSP